MNLPNLMTFPNGEKPVPTFTDGEMEGRLVKLRQSMAEQGVEVVLFTSNHSINYYADYMYCSFGRFYGVVVDDKTNTLISARVDGGQPWRRAFGDNLVYTDWQQDNYFRAVQKLIKDGRVVGVEFDHINAHNLEKLKAALPNSRIVDIAPTTMALRMVKTDAEVALMTRMAAIADLGGAACVEAIAPGVGEHEIALHSTQTMVREIAATWPNAELRDTWAWVQSGINTDGAHNPVTSRRLERGDPVSLNCFPMVAGYYVALERTLFCQTATDENLRLWAINCQVHDAGKALIVPGARCCDIARELNKIYEEHNLLEYRTFGYGHSFGIVCHYYGREAGLELREDIETVLEPNMVLSMEPMLLIPEGMDGAGGYREHDVLVVTADGHRNITAFPYGPAHNIVGATAE